MVLPTAVRQEIQVGIGQAGLSLGTLVYARQGRRVIARDHAKRRRVNPQLPALTELDYLLAVDDFSRVGALRLGNADGAWQRTVAQGQRSTPPLIELESIFQATRAVGRKPPRICATCRARVRIPVMVDSDSIPIADSVPDDGGYLAREP